MQINLGILNLLGNIVTTNAIYLSSTFKLLVRTFIPDATVSSKGLFPLFLCSSALNDIFW